MPAALPTVYPAKLRRGDRVRVIAPAMSRAMVNEHDHSALIEARFADMGLTLSYGAHVDERDERDSSSVAARVADLHDAFADDSVAGVLSVIGGYNSNELLPHLDWDLIRAHPKVFCGYSDITALSGAILARTGLVTYSGPHWSSFGMRLHFDQTWKWFAEALFEESPVTISPAQSYTDDRWFLDQADREVLPTGGWWPIQRGRADGRLVGGNLCTLNLLQGTAYLPSLTDAVLIVEDDEETRPGNFTRDLTSLLQLPAAAGIQGLVIGRFQRVSGMDRSTLERLVERLPGLAGRPVLGNVDVGHTAPMATLPIGGEVTMYADDSPRLVLTRH